MHSFIEFFYLIISLQNQKNLKKTNQIIMLQNEESSNPTKPNHYANNPQTTCSRVKEKEKLAQLTISPTIDHGASQQSHQKERQNPHSHLELDQIQFVDSQSIQFGYIKKTANHQHQPLEQRPKISPKDILQDLGNPQKSALIKNQSSKLSQQNLLGKSATNLKTVHQTQKSRQTLNHEKLYSNAQSKVTGKQNFIVRKNWKNKHSYDQLMDKNLIQYLYTRQNKIFQQADSQENIIPQKKETVEQSRQTNRKSITKKLPSKLKITNKKPKPFEIRKDCGNAQFTIFDAISCEQSKRLNQKFRMSRTMKSSKEIASIQNENKHELQVLKNRMIKLEETVYHKVPFLVEMGVKFKCKKQ